MALPSSKFTAIALGVVTAVTIGSVAVSQLLQETYTPSVVNPDIQVVGEGEIAVTCTGTGGNVKVSGGAKYDTCIIAPTELTSTGAIERIALEIISAPATVNLDCGFVKGANSGTGAAFQNLSNISTGTGKVALFASGSLRWNPADYIKCGTLANPTSPFSAVLRVKYREDYSE